MPVNRYITSDKARVYQGDILKGFSHDIATVKDGSLEVVRLEEPFVVVVSQECDLLWDFEWRKDASRADQDKFVSDVIVIPAYPAEQLKEGTHLEELGLKMRSDWGGSEWKSLERNKNERYYFLPESSEFKMPQLVLDFKRYYTVSREAIYRVLEEKYFSSIATLFREDLSCRFANFLSRIGLPEK